MPAQRHAAAHPDPLAFYRALNACSEVRGATPQPLVARDSGIVAAWERFAKAHGAAPGAMADARQRFPHNLDLLSTAILRDPLVIDGCVGFAETQPHARSAVILAVASLMFWRRDHVVIELTDALERRLIATPIGAGVPATRFRPPASACFVRFGPAFRAATPPFGDETPDGAATQGVYVFESKPAHAPRVLTLVPAVVHDTTSEFSASALELTITDEPALLEPAIRASCATIRHFGAHQESVARLLAKVFLYLQFDGATRYHRRDAQCEHIMLGRRC